MAIAPSNSGTATWSGTSPLAVTVTINNGDTATAVIGLIAKNTTPDAVTSITGGGTWTMRDALTSGILRMEIWSTPVNGATAASSISVAFGTTDMDDVNVCVETYTGAASLGITATNTATDINPTVALTTQDSNNWVVAGATNADGAQIPAPAQVGTWRSNNGGGGQTNHNNYSELQDNTAGSPSSVVNTTSQLGAARLWVTVALELRTVAGGAVDRDVIVRYGNMGTTTGSGLVMAAFLAQATTAVSGGYQEWYYENVVQDGV